MKILKLSIIFFIIIFMTTGCNEKALIYDQELEEETAVPVQVPDNNIDEENSESTYIVSPSPTGTIFQNNIEDSIESNEKLKEKIICVDAGHGITKNNKQEPVAPNSKEMKPAHVSGTKGSKLTEEQLNLIVALKLKDALEMQGAKVVMTRNTAECNLSNVDRAKLATDESADITIRIHADGGSDSGVSGMSILVPSSKHIKDEYMINNSRKAGNLILEETIKVTGAKNKGIIERSDMTGFNWSTIPVILIEMGFMSNPEEDRRLSSDDYQNKIVDGIKFGLLKYFDVN